MEAPDQPFEANWYQLRVFWSSPIRRLYCTIIYSLPRKPFIHNRPPLFPPYLDVKF